ncbi:MAG: hypothetical protein A2Y80_04085 [Deltaproteobacteria bacterium RBG_13_58_19]|nr:MAG: hypothetical protein A2Y80_04085 [Deltaproteobacteria bacterium RBG_13_58_19]
MVESEDKGYTVADKRFQQMSEEEKARVREEEAAARQAASEATEAAKEVPLPEVTFSSFLLSLSSSIFVNLGDMADPATGETQKDLPLAKQTIDLLGLLREKTRNNLTPDEENLYDHLLYDLRMRYIKEVG